MRASSEMATELPIQSPDAPVGRSFSQFQVEAFTMRPSGVQNHTEPLPLGEPLFFAPTATPQPSALVATALPKVGSPWSVTARVAERHQPLDWVSQGR